MSGRRVILLVEDEEAVRDYFSHLLQKNAWTVVAVGAPRDALLRLEETDFDVVLCDLDLGRGPNGLEVLAKMPPRNQGKPFVILTSHGSTERCREAFLLGVTDFLEKPSAPRMLIATLDRLLSAEVESLPAVAVEDVGAEYLEDSAGAQHVRRAIQIIERRYAEIDLTVVDLAKEVGVSAEHLSRLFGARTGQTPLDYLHGVRIRASELLLDNTHLSVYEVARECGYRATSEFGNWFRRLRGSTPSASRGRRSPNS